MDPLIPLLATSALVALLVGVLLRRFGQPAVVGYLLAGVLLGPDVLGLLEDHAIPKQIGAVGVLLLLFFVGMEMSLPKLLERWRVPVLGTVGQVAGSLGAAWLIGNFLGWSVARIVLLGFVISLSSTAVVIKLLEDRGEMHTEVGRNVIGVLVTQDLIIIPMIIVLGLLGGGSVNLTEVGLQLVGALLVVGLLYEVARGRHIPLPFANAMRRDPETQVFAAFILCLGLSLLTGLLHLSAALGAFVAGIVLSATDETHWIKERLEPFRVVFVAIFFVSIGMSVDLELTRERWLTISLLVAAALVTNTTLNAVTFRVLGESWRRSLYAGSLLAQIGEFSFVLAAVGLQAGIIVEVAYQVTVAVIFVTLLLSPFWIAPFSHLARAERPGRAPASTPTQGTR